MGDKGDQLPVIGGSNLYILKYLIFYLYRTFSYFHRMNNNSILIPAVVSIFLTGMFSGIWYSAGPAYAQNTINQTTATAVEQLTSNLTQARDAVATGNSTLATAQLAGIIGELSDILGGITTDTVGANTDTHTHFFVHKGHVHSVTHKHPHHPSHHHDWFETHHEFNPSDCKPGLMC